MHSAKKVTLVPPEQTGGAAEDEVIDSGSYSGEVSKNEKYDKIKYKIYDKIHRFIKVILKLAKSNSYDEESLRIKTKNGTYLEKSNIVDLLTHSMSIGKVLHGEDEFIALLAENNVDPDLILNENVKSKLLRYRNIPASKKEVTQRIINKKDDEVQVVDKPKEIRKGNKKFIVVNANDEQEIGNDEPTSGFKRKITPLDEDSHQNKRKRTDTDENEDSVDDEMIDNTRWKI